MAEAVADMAHRPPRIWMDVTTSLRDAASPANGTLRVERAFADGLRSELGERLSFCRYASPERRFVPADRPAAFHADSNPRGPSRLGARRPDTIGRRVERGLRLTLRRWSRALHDRAAPRKSGARFVEARSGDALLLGGETWSARYDFDVLRQLRNETGVRIAAICQDVIPQTHPQFFESQAFVARHRDYVDWLVADVDLVVVHSRAVQADLIGQAKARGRTPPQIALVPLGSDIAVHADPKPPATDPPLLPGSFAIAVSTIQTRKNFDLLYRLWHHFAKEGRSDLPTLVMVGAQGFGSDALLREIAHDPLVRDNLVVLHNAGDAELAWLYRNCRFTLYPSFAEGWGLPITESLAYGKPCLASNTTSMPEAGGGFAVHLDPTDFQGWHDAIVAWTDNSHELDMMSRRIALDYRPTTWTQSSEVLATNLRNLVDA